ncbi:MAG: GTP 3',8-cyclase MoaA, partial [Allobranchiibius sp.]
MTRTPVPLVPVLGDRFGRVAADLRVSVTDRCNLRCTYCMPAEGLDWMPKPEMLTDDELVRVIGIFVDLGVRQIRFTGGEPILRRSLVDIVRRVGELPNAPRMAMTTNGIGLDRLAQPLADAGLHRVNVSLDTASPDRFKELTRRDRFHDVERGLKAAADAGLAPVKVNAVAMRSDTESPADLLAWCLDRGYQLRFIEQMPLDAGHVWDRSTMMTGAELHTAIQERFTLTALPAGARGSA